MVSSNVARRIRLLGLDVDGVLTDNSIVIGLVEGVRVEFKRFDIQDGLGLGLLRGSSIDVVWVSGRESAATMLRASELRIREVLQVPAIGKLEAVEALLARRGLGWEHMAFVGDDLADAEVLQRVGLPIAVANAVEEIKRLAAFVTTRPGGHGAVREVVEALLKARGEWERAIAPYTGSPVA